MALSEPPRFLLAAASLPPIISFSASAAPLLTLTLTLQQSSKPITFLRLESPLNALDNHLTIRNIRTGTERHLPTIDANYRHLPPVRLTVSQADRFITLWPQEPYEPSVSFRPLGHAQSVDSLVAEGQSKYRFLCMGMHLLEVGEEYTIAFKQGLRIRQWMEGSIDDLLAENGLVEHEGALWRPRSGDPIEVIPQEPCTFRVEA